MILPWLILIPFIGGFLCWIAEHSSKTLPRWIALLSMTLVLILLALIAFIVLSLSLIHI